MNQTKSDKIIMYGSSTCLMVPPVRQMLKRSSVEFDYIDITRDHCAREHVLQINHGNASVPTLVFPDGTTLTEPSGHALRRKLHDLGYEVPLLARVAGNALYLILGTIFLLTLLDITGVV